MARQAGEIGSIGELMEKIQINGLGEVWTPHVQLWFRGHGNKDWRLEPGAYRSGLPEDEDDQIRYERHLCQDFISFSANVRRNNESDADLYFIQQHYSMPTRLLDWSGNPLAALFFALTPSDTDGELFMLDSYRFKGGHKTARHGDLQEALQAIYGWKNAAWPANIMAVRPPSQDHRVVAQRGFFTFHPRRCRYVDESSNPTLISYVIPKDAKEKIRAELERADVNDFTIYGDLDHLASWLKRAYQNASTRRLV